MQVRDWKFQQELAKRLAQDSRECAVLVLEELQCFCPVLGAENCKGIWGVNVANCCWHTLVLARLESVFITVLDGFAEEAFTVETLKSELPG